MVKLWSLVCLLAAALVLVDSKGLPKKAGIPQVSITHEATQKIAVDPKAYVELGGRQYYFSVIAVSYKEAVQSCQDAGMELVSIEGADEHALLVDYIDPIFGVGPWWWSSGVRLGSDWFWSSSSRYFSFSDWYSGYPRTNGSSTQACVYFDTWGWQDVSPCTLYSAQFVCERNHNATCN